MSVTDYVSPVKTTTATISSSGTKTGAIDLGGCQLTGFQLPASFTGTAITFEVSPDNSTFQALYDKNNAAISFTVTQGRTYALGDLIQSLAGYRYMKLVSGSTEGADRTITLFARPL